MKGYYIVNPPKRMAGFELQTNTTNFYDPPITVNVTVNDNMRFVAKCYNDDGYAELIKDLKNIKL